MRLRFPTTIAALVTALLLPFLCPFGVADDANIQGPPAPAHRALLIACDEYISYPDMTPTAHNNLLAMESMLARDTRGFTISRQDGITQSAEALQAAIEYAFADAVEGDISYLYISAHGDFNARYPSPQGELILSDGMMEARLSSQTLQAMLDPIPGTKLLIVDACNSGALIGKGISINDAPERLAEAFTSPDYKALVSSGGSEPSWYWRSDSGGPPLSSSYFTMALVEGAGYYGEYAADDNQDGNITLSELYDYLRISYAAATAQVSPIGDDFVVFRYDPDETTAAQAPLSGFKFERTVLNADAPELRFSFTVAEPTRVGYQLVFMRGGLWDWQNARAWLDMNGGDMNDGQTNPTPVTPNASDAKAGDGTLQPGLKTRTLSLYDISPTDWGYALLNVVRYENGRPIVCASRVISIEPLMGDPRLTIKPMTTAAYNGFYASASGPLTLWVGHAFPVTLTLTVSSVESGGISSTVRTLSSHLPTRPQGLTPLGSLFYWDGLDDGGVPVQSGTYKIEASVVVGQYIYTTSYDIDVTAVY